MVQQPDRQVDEWMAFPPQLEKLYYHSEEELKSTSKNSAYIGIELQGKVLGSINNGRITLNE